MTNPEMTERRVAALSDRHGRTFAAEPGIPLADGAPEALFRWVVACNRDSAPMDARMPPEAAAAMAKAGRTTADALAANRWRRVAPCSITRATPATTSAWPPWWARPRRTCATAGTAISARCARPPAETPTPSRACSGRALQSGRPRRRSSAARPRRRGASATSFCDEKASGAAMQLEFARSVKELARSVPPAGLPRLLAALARCALARDANGVRGAAQAGAAVGDGE